ncbi:hypothetical protein AVEN_224284-1 [Araneus ventricosus]|uniref:Histone-lysine N-methyltransferase SETMAR n=1 Tax=Araneus ventricosus TaxID=182803 RepID=A0A4Y2U4G8_ARAVE|nr:hypothetical protein AVEN_224284-1 [Araneus ventricosus]
MILPIANGDERFVRHFQFRSERQSVRQKRTKSTFTRKFRTFYTRVEMDLFDRKGSFFSSNSWTKVNNQRYHESLKKLRNAVNSKHPGRPSRGVILLQHNARPHTAKEEK